MTAPGLINRDRVAVAAAVIAPIAVCALLGSVRDSITSTDAVLALVLVVVAVAANGYRLAGNLAAVSAAASFDFFLTEPYGRLTIDRSADIKTTVLLLVVGVAVSELAVWGRRQAALASTQTAYLDGIREATEAVSSGGSGRQLTQDVSAALTRLLNLASCRFERGMAGVGQPARLRHDGEVEVGHAVWDVERNGLPADTDIELLVEVGGRLVGRFMLTAGPHSHPSRAQLLVAVTMASQVGRGVSTS